MVATDSENRTGMKYVSGLRLMYVRNIMSAEKLDESSLGVGTVLRFSKNVLKRSRHDGDFYFYRESGTRSNIHSSQQRPRLIIYSSLWRFPSHNVLVFLCTRFRSTTLKITLLDAVLVHRNLGFLTNSCARQISPPVPH